MLMMAAMGAAVLLASGVAYALSVQCDGAGDQDPDPGQCRGNAENDVIVGTDLPDVIFALNGYDRVNSGPGRDELRGGNLGDYLAGEDGSDTYFGGSGADFFTEDRAGCCEPSFTGNDEMDGGDGPDYMEAGQGDDVLRGQAGDESELTFRRTNQ